MKLDLNLINHDIESFNIDSFFYQNFYNKINFAIILKLIYFYGYTLDDLKNYILPAFTKLKSEKNFFDIFIEETNNFG